MRNHAARLIQTKRFDRTGDDRLVSNCLRTQLTAKPDHACHRHETTAHEHSLDINPGSRHSGNCSDFNNFTPERIDDLLWTLFWPVCGPFSENDTRTNIAI